jgi:hypothetical protein
MRTEREVKERGEREIIFQGLSKKILTEKEGKKTSEKPLKILVTLSTSFQIFPKIKKHHQTSSQT